MPKRRLIAISVAVSIAASLAATAAGATCDADKIGGLSHATGETVRCRARAAMRGLSPATCPDDIDASLDEAFTHAEGLGGCASSGELPDVGASLHSFDAELASDLVTTPSADKCASAKLRAVARRVRRELACHRDAALHAAATDPACIAPSQADLTKAFTRLDGRGHCAVTGDAPGIETLVADFLAFATARIRGVEPPPSPRFLSASVSGADIALEWTAADPGSGLTVSRLLRRLNAEVAGPEDPEATVVYEGAQDTVADDLTALLPDTTTVDRVYHYAVYGCDELGACETNGSSTSISPTVRQALVAGGYVIFWRHASADVCSDRTDLGTAATTSSPDWWKSCDANCGTATARQLNTSGLNESAAIGSAFDTLGIAVGRIRSSEFCRNVQTAELMDFGPAVEQVQELTYYVYDEANRCSNTLVMLAEPPAAGTNSALIGHAGNSCAPLSSLAWAEAAIYRPDGLGSSLFIERVTAASWLSLP